MGLPPPEGEDVQRDFNPGSGLEENDVASVSSIEEHLESFDETLVQSPLSNRETEGEGSLPVIGISVRYWHPERKELKAVAEGLKALAVQRPVHLRFLPFISRRILRLRSLLLAALAIFPRMVRLSVSIVMRSDRRTCHERLAVVI